MAKRKEKNAKKRTSFRNIVSTILFFLAIIVLFYPIVSNYLAGKQMTQSIQNYKKTYYNESKEKQAQQLSYAKKYNEYIYDKANLIPWSGQIPQYNQALEVDKTGMMGYLSIPQIKLKNLPIYHGATEEILAGGIGHLPQTSLPIGGKSTHSVLPAHSGRVNDSLFTDLDKLKLGDVFYIHVLNQNLKYQIDNIKIVKPNQISSLSIVKGKDLVTLVTCYPTGINNERLLVTGQRVPYSEKIPNESIQRNKYGYDFWVILFSALLAILGLSYLIYWLLDMILLSLGHLGRLWVPKIHLNAALIYHGKRVRRANSRIDHIEILSLHRQEPIVLPEHTGKVVMNSVEAIETLSVGDQFYIRRLLRKKNFQIVNIQKQSNKVRVVPLHRANIITLSSSFDSEYCVLITGKILKKTKTKTNR